jgi:hypothetical protein
VAVAGRRQATEITQAEGDTGANLDYRQARQDIGE